MSKPIPSSIVAFLLFAGIAAAVTVVLTVFVGANITAPLSIIFGQSLIGEENSKTLFIVNSTVTDIIHINSTCANPDIFSAIVTTPTGSSQSQFTFTNNGTTNIMPNITVGNVVLKKRSLAQGTANCTLVFGVSPTTNITYVGELP